MRLDKMDHYACPFCEHGFATPNIDIYIGSIVRVCNECKAGGPFVDSDWVSGVARWKKINRFIDGKTVNQEERTMSDETQKPQPLRCPFCLVADMPDEGCEVASENDVVFVRCYGCHAQGPQAYSREEALEPWNEVSRIVMAEIMKSAKNHGSDMVGQGPGR